MPAFLHEALIALFRNRPELATELLQRVMPFPTGVQLSARDADASEPVVVERRADLVVELRDHAQRIRGAVIIEVQLEPDGEKRFVWPQYVVSVRARIRGPVTLLIVAPRRRTAEWARQPIEIGHPSFALRPIVFGPDEIPIATSAEIRLSPEFGVLSVVAHGAEPTLAERGEDVMRSIAHLDADRARLYTDLVLSAARHEQLRAALEAAMQKMKYEYQSDFAKKYYGEGLAEGLAKALLAFLRGRGIEVDHAAHERILSCRDTAVLDAWIARAASIERTEELFG